MRWLVVASAAFDRFWFTPVPATRLAAVRILVCAVALYDVLLYGPAVLADARAVDAGAGHRPWNPIFLLEVLKLGPLGFESAQLLYTVALTALTLAAVGVFSRLSCAVGALAFLWLTGLAYSFGKPHHDKVALAFALCALPFARIGARLSVDAVIGAVLRARRDQGSISHHEDAPVSGVPIRLTQVTIAIGYFGAGTAKVVLGGPDWFNGYTLQGIMLGHDGEWSRLFAASPWFCQLQSLGLVFVQVAFPLVFFVPNLRWFFLPAAAGFHLMTWKTMDTGPYMRLWLLLFLFVPMERIPAAMAGCLSAGGLRRLFALAAMILLPVLVVSIVKVVVPEVVLAVVVVFLGVTALLHLMPWAAVQLWIDGSTAHNRVLAALVRGADPARRVMLLDTRDNVDPDAGSGMHGAHPSHELRLVNAAGQVQTGVAACRSLCWRLPLLWPVVLLGSLPGLSWLFRRFCQALKLSRAASST